MLNAVIGRPIKKCPGVSAKASLRLFETDVIGLEFKIASIFVNSALKSSKNICSSHAAVHVAFQGFDSGLP